MHTISQIPFSNRRPLWTTFTTCNEPIPDPFTSQKKCNAGVSCTWNSTSTFPIHFHSGVLGKETLWLCVLQLTIKTNYDLRPEHQPALHRAGAWAGESGPCSSVTQSRYSGSDWRLHVSGAVYKVREGQENQGRKKDGMKEHAQMRHRSGTDISLRRLTGKLQKRYKAESVGIQRSSAGKTVPLDAKKACGKME